MNKVDADRIIEGYVKKLLGFVVSKLGNIDEAEEQTKGIFIILFLG